MQSDKARILVMIAHYLPGFRSGGPIRSISNLAEKFGDSFDFRIVTRDRDYLSPTPFENVATDCWVKVGHAAVRYLPGYWGLLFRIYSILRKGEFELVFLNSLFERRFSLLPLLLRRLGLVKPCPFVLAPRGELSEGALAIRHIRKRIFLAVAKRIGLYRGVIWQASHQLEQQEILREFGAQVTVHVVPDAHMPGPYGRVGVVEKQKGCASTNGLRVVFLSRISPKKNLKWAIGVLAQCKCEISFDVYGPIDDQAYWAECLAEASRLPRNISFRYCGEISHNQVAKVFGQFDLFLFPSCGENYGHVIIESLAAGCPVLLSDRTPWLDLEVAGAGWVRALGDVRGFVNALEHFAALSAEQRMQASIGARTYALEHFFKLQQSGTRFEIFSQVLA